MKGKKLTKTSVKISITVISIAILFSLIGCNEADSPQQANDTATAKVKSENVKKTEIKPKTIPQESKMADSAAKSTSVKISTSKGDITVALNTEKAPITVANFLTYVEEGFFSETIFHRVIKGFMIQGGGMNADMSQKKTHAPIQNEAANGLKNDKGSIAMARTNDPHSATAQFFINVADNDFLNAGARDAGYAVFGMVTDGMDVVEAIESVSTQPGDVPTETVLINSITVVE